MTNPRVQIDIAANDATGKGISSAEKRLDHLGGRGQKIGKDLGKIGDRRGLGGLLKTFGEVENAASGAFGSKSVLGTLSGRLGGVQKIGATISRSLGSARASSLRTTAALGEVEAAGEGAATGLGEAAVAGGLAEGAIIGVGVATAATAGILVAAAAASFKLADGWAKGAASIGRTAEIIGVASDKLQQFQGAAERVGVDKATAGAAMGGLSQTLNDARYGKNGAAAGTLAFLGVKMKTNADGTVDVGAMLPAIADAMQKQTSTGRRSLAATLGIPQAAIPALAQGSKALSGDMADYGRNGPVQSGADIDLGKKLQRRDTIAAQWVSGRANDLNRDNAHLVNGAGDLLVSGAAKIGPAATQLGAAAGKLDRAAGRLSSGLLIGRADAQTAEGLAMPGARLTDGVGAAMNSGFARSRHLRGVHGAGRYSATQIATFARRAMPMIAEAQAAGFTGADAIAVAANVEMESGGRTNSREGGGRGPGRGLLQLTDRKRKASFQSVEGVDIELADRQSQWHHMRWETGHTEASTWRLAHRHGDSAADVAAGYARYVVRPANKPRDSAERAAVAEAMTINLQFTGLPQGTGVTASARSNRGTAPAISHAFHR